MAALGPALGLSVDQVTRGSALAMVVFGAALLLPALGRGFARLSTPLAASADARIGALPRSLGAESLGGALLGAVWSPCIGPTLCAAIALAATGRGLGQAALTMTGFALGVASLILVAAHGLRRGLRARSPRLIALSNRARPLMGLAFALIGLALFFNLHHGLEAAALRLLPIWLIDLSTAL